MHLVVEQLRSLIRAEILLLNVQIHNSSASRIIDDAQASADHEAGMLEEYLKSLVGAKGQSS